MTALDRVAVVSDVHGNLTAYQAVLADIDARGITRIVNLGDVVGKGPRGAACVRLTPGALRGDGAGQLGDVPQRAAPTGEAAWWWDRARSPTSRTGCAALPFHHDLVLSGRRIRMLHASPQGVFSRVLLPAHPRSSTRGMFVNTEHTGDGPAADAASSTATSTAPTSRATTTRPSSTSAASGTRWTPPPPPTSSSRASPTRWSRRRSAIQFVRVPFDTEAEIAAADGVRHAGGPRVRGRAADRPVPGLPEGLGGSSVTQSSEWLTTLMTVPFGARTKNRRTPHGSVVSGWTIS